MEGSNYDDKIKIYQGDSKILLGRLSMFSDYIREFANGKTGHGIDIGAGPGGCNGKYFTNCNSLDGCDANESVVQSLSDTYDQKFHYVIGYDVLEKTYDFIVCSCVIQHLNNVDELIFGLTDMYEGLNEGGELYLMFKAGCHNTLLTHYNSYYNETRTFRVFDPEVMSEILTKIGFTVKTEEKLMDEHWIPYSCMIMVKPN